MRRPSSVLLHLLVVTFAAVSAALGIARFETVHNETFDLAFYARMAWGLAGGDPWEPIIGANVLGLHLSPILIPLGALGRLTSTVHVLLIAQAFAVAASAYPFARMAARRFELISGGGQRAGFLVAASYLLYPNLIHVATFEFHPGTLAVLPFAWAIDAVDRRSARQLVWAVIGVLACREDLALATMLLCSLAAKGSSPFARTARRTALASLGWVLVFALLLHPLFAPSSGSLEAHFAKWGGSIFEVGWSWLTRPLEVARHLAAPERLVYLPLILAPVLFLPLVRPRFLLPALPVVGINLLSAFPGTCDIDSHYLTAAVPFIAAAAIEGATSLARLGRPGPAASPKPASPKTWILAPWLVAALVAQGIWGGSPWSRAFEEADFIADPQTIAARSILRAIPDRVAVQAPEPLLAHLIRRRFLHRPPPPEMRADRVVLDLSHRLRYFGNETVLRTAEEPIARAWLARPDHGVTVAAPPYVLLEKGADPRGTRVARRYLIGKSSAESGTRITSCLKVLEARALAEERVEVRFAALGPCPSDLAIRIGTAIRPAWVELPFEGVLSPAHLRRGDLVRSPHLVLGSGTAREITIGAIRASGARPEHSDPWAIRVPLQR